MGEPTKILLVDDSEDDRYLFRRCLKASTTTSYAVTEAGTAEQGLNQIDREWFACVLLDYSQPDRNGVAILKPIRSAHPFLPVIMLTGLGNETVAVAAMRAGAQNYIVKSTVTAQTLEHAVQGAMQHCEMQRRIADQSEALEIFARALAHDLKEPLRTMRSMLNAIQEEATFPGETLEYFRSVQNCAVRMTALIDTVRVYTRRDGEQPIACDEYDANELVGVIHSRGLRECWSSDAAP